MRPLLEIRDLTVTYLDRPGGRGRGLVALTGVSLEVGRGEVAAVLGRNGAGKSSLVRAVAGILGIRRGRVGPGSVVFGGRDITALGPAPRVRAGIATVLEGHRVFPDLTIADHLRLGGLAGGRRGSAAPSTAEVLDRFPALGRRLGMRAGNLSGGEQQQLGLARALMSGPDLLVADEPALGLAPRLVAAVGELVAGLASEGTAVVLVEQHAAMALGVATRAHVLDRGRIVAAAAPREVMADVDLRVRYLGLPS